MTDENVITAAQAESREPGGGASRSGWREGAGGNESAPILALSNLSKSFGETPVLRGLSLELRKGEFFTLLGSSGCGKTTTLRIIAGLDAPDEGAVLLGGRDITALPPNKRNVNTVFQSYALFPHLDVFQNVAYGLKLRRVPRAERDVRVQRALDLVQLTGYEHRKPNELSGGQRQRAAIARAIVVEPEILLLDEPLGALDLKLRKSMQFELKRLQEKLGITFVYVTHDQEEALTMSDRIGVMKDGRFEQIGKPEEIYQAPANRYVADFIGDTNLIRARVLGEGSVPGAQIYQLEFGAGRAGARSQLGVGLSAGDEVTVSVRPEHIRYTVNAEASEIMPFAATVISSQFVGSHYKSEILLEDGTTIVASNSNLEENIRAGVHVRVGWDPQDAILIEGAA